MQPLIALDEFINTLVWASGEGFGMADETLSARMWRLGEIEGRRNWLRARKIVDGLFFWDREWSNEKGCWIGHCELSFASEMTRQHLPVAYRK